MELPLNNDEFWHGKPHSVQKILKEIKEDGGGSGS